MCSSFYLTATFEMSFSGEVAYVNLQRKVISDLPNSVSCQNQHWEGGPAFFFMMFNVIVCAEAFFHLGEGEICLGKLYSFRSTFLFTSGFYTFAGRKCIVFLQITTILESKGQNSAKE